MNNNDILRKVRYAFNLKDSDTINIFSLAGENITQEKLNCLFRKEEDDNFELCTDDLLSAFLDGLIIKRRGPKDDSSGKKNVCALSNNIILKKLRIALEFKEDSMLEAFKLAGFELSKPELSAFFRNPEHKNYKECGDQWLRNFLKGISIMLRDGKTKE